MPNPFSKIIDDIKGAVDVPIPPGFQPIADMLLPNSFKSGLSRIIKSAPPDFMNNREWWSAVKKLTDASFEDMKMVFLDVKKADQQPRNNVLNVLSNFTKLPIVAQDPAIQKMIRSYANGARNGTADVESLLKMQKILAQRMQKLQKKLENKETTAERFKRSTQKQSDMPSDVNSAADVPGAVESKGEQGRPISEDLVVEGMLADVVSKMTAYFSNPNLAAVMSGEKKDAQRAKNLAKAAVYSLLQRINDNAYAKLQKHGIDQKTLLKIYKTRNQPDNKALYYRAARIVGSKKYAAPQVTKPTKPAEQTRSIKSAETENSAEKQDPRTAETLHWNRDSELNMDSDYLSNLDKSFSNRKSDARKSSQRNGRNNAYNISTRGRKHQELSADADNDYDWWENSDRLADITDDVKNNRKNIQQIEEEPDSIELDSLNQNEVNTGSMDQDTMMQDQGAPIKEKPDELGSSQDELGSSQDEQEQEPTMGAKIYRKIMSIARAAKAAGQDPTAMADYALQRYEDEGVPEAAIVRRMFERSRANQVKKEQKLKLDTEGSSDPLQ